MSMREVARLDGLRSKQSGLGQLQAEMAAFTPTLLAKAFRAERCNDLKITLAQTGSLGI